MAITKELIEDKIEVEGPYKIIQVRTSVIIKEDGNIISSSFIRDSFPPDKDSSNASAGVKAMVAQFHTDAVKTAYANRPKLGVD